MAKSDLISVEPIELDVENPVVSFVYECDNAEYDHTLEIDMGYVAIIEGISLPIGHKKATVEISPGHATNLMARFPNSPTAECVLTLKTYLNDTLVGSDTYTATAFTTAEHSGPTLSAVELVDTSAAASMMEGTGYLSTISTLTATETASAKNGASLTTRSAYFTGSGRTYYSQTSSVSGIRTNVDRAGNYDLVYTVADSRGYTASMTKSVRVFMYQPIKIDFWSMIRENNVLPTIKLTLDGTLTPVMYNNAALNTLNTARYRVREDTASSYGSWTNIKNLLTTTNSTFECTNLSLPTTLSDASAWYVELEVSDLLNTVTVTSIIPKGTPILALRDGKVGINNNAPQFPLDVTGTIAQNGVPVHGVQMNDIGDDADANDFTTPGIYFNYDYIVTTANHWPRTGLGMLEVFASSHAIHQRYTSFEASNSRMYVRHKLGNNNWIEWIQLL